MHILWYFPSPTHTCGVNQSKQSWYDLSYVFQSLYFKKIGLFCFVLRNNIILAQKMSISNKIGEIKITVPYVIICGLCPSRTWKLILGAFPFHFLILALRTVGALGLKFRALIYSAISCTLLY